MRPQLPHAGRSRAKPGPCSTKKSKSCCSQAKGSSSSTCPSSLLKTQTNDSPVVLLFWPLLAPLKWMGIKFSDQFCPLQTLPLGHILILLHHSTSSTELSEFWGRAIQQHPANGSIPSQPTSHQPHPLEDKKSLAQGISHLQLGRIPTAIHSVGTQPSSTAPCDPYLNLIPELCPTNQIRKHR